MGGGQPVKASRPLAWVRASRRKLLCLGVKWGVPGEIGNGALIRYGVFLFPLLVLGMHEARQAPNTHQVGGFGRVDRPTRVGRKSAPTALRSERVGCKLQSSHGHLNEAAPPL